MVLRCGLTSDGCARDGPTVTVSHPRRTFVRMETGDVQVLVARVAGIPDHADRATLASGLADLERLAAWCEAHRLRLANRLAPLAPFPEAAIADATRTSPRQARRLLDRAATADDAPTFADALANGTVTAEHLDALGNALRRLDTSDQQAALTAQAQRLRIVAEATTPDEFTRHLRAEVRRLQTDHGMRQLERQRRNTRLRTFVDRTDGMWCLTGRFDPATGLHLDARLRAMVDQLFTDAEPESCPTDPGEKQDHLRALALVALIDGGAPAPGRPEIIVVIDPTSPEPDGTPRTDWGLPVELPWPHLANLYPEATVHPVVVAHGVVIHAPGTLNLGRTTRLANRAQRRALRALYPTCAIPDCDVRFDRCKIHHVIWWERGGPTDLDNLLPVCEHHHQAIHGGWQLALSPDRTLTLTYPDHTTRSCGPPSRGRPTERNPRTSAITRPTTARGSTAASPSAPDGAGPTGTPPATGPPRQRSP